MYGSRTAPGLFSFNRSTALFFSVWASLSSGSNYVVGAYLPQLGARLNLSHTKLNVFAVAGNIGVYMSGPFLGKIVDARGPRPLLIAAFILLLSGYSGIRGIFDAGLGEGKDLSTLRLIILVLCSCFSGIGGHAGMASAMNTTAKNFPDHLRAVTVGLVMSGFGLSAFFFSSISHTLFPGNTSDFLLVLALGTAIPMIFGFFFVRIIPLPSHGASAVEVGSSNNYQPLATDSDERRHYGSRSKILQYQSDVVDEGESREPMLRPSHESSSNSVELFPSSGFHNRDSPGSNSHPIEEPQSKNAVEGRGVNLYRWTLWKSIDFWIMCSMHALLAGTGLMYINNAGSIAQALLAHRKPDYDEAESAIWQAAQVSAISLASFSGRILIGIVADMAKSRLRVPRSFCMPAMCALFILSQLSLVAIGDVRHLWMASVLLGLAYGCWFGLLPTISIEWFGLAHFSENWGIISVFPVLGGNLFSIAFGRNLDAHEPSAATPSPSIANTRCLDGRGCYVQTLYLNIWACVIALGFSFWAGRRDWMHWQGRDQPRERMNTVVWEDTGEAVGPEDLEP